ncbi:post-transcriptional regulator [Neobacillus sp. MM2021_6]|uniref:post-transcriptional regulator n=1 Tax=Bacillaceae TaxID=186817 RepID=UPI00140A045B|nr:MULTISPECIES: post-transcriptional regulator [Bacillaceae]MBO0960749.1 post-transcriptional regulator [Neobacillus sp. MM2021_6]NHC17329.1 post-transcriptional regulator [Bacillus sp. MM2020_4]
MGNSNKYEHFRTQVQPACASKLAEFRLLGIDSVTEEEFWEYLVKKKWKKENEEKLLYQLIQEILSVKASDYISFATIEAYKTAEFSMEDEAELKELLK